MSDIESNWWDTESSLDERYGTLAWGGDGTAEAVQPTIDAILENIQKFMPATSGTVLEVGCGPGRILHRLARANPDLMFYGRDISLAMTALGDADRPENVMIQIVNGTEGIERIDGGYDLIYSVEVFQHVHAFAKAWYLTEIAESLSPAGVAIIQYVEGSDDGAWMNYPASKTEMAAAARSAKLKIRRLSVPNQIHDEWQWMVLGR